MTIETLINLEIGKDYLCMVNRKIGAEFHASVYLNDGSYIGEQYLRFENDLDMDSIEPLSFISIFVKEINPIHIVGLIGEIDDFRIPYGE